MFFETANIKRGYASEKPPGKPIQPVRNAPDTTTRNQPVTNTVAPPRRTNPAMTVTARRHPGSTGFVRKNVPSPAAVSNARSSSVNRAAAAMLQKKVSGWPTRKEGIQKRTYSYTEPPAKPASYLRKNVKLLQTSHRPAFYNKPGYKMQQQMLPGNYGKRRNFATTAVTPNFFKGWGAYPKDIGDPAHSRVRGWKTYYTNAPNAQTANVYLPQRSARYADQTMPAKRAWKYSLDTSVQQQPSYSTFNARPSYKQTIYKRRACRICGCTNNSCDTLSGFAVDSTQLNAVHKSQADVLAKKILTQKIRSVTATGYTDASGSDDYNLKLGYRRAQNVIKEIMNKMHLIKPYSEQNVFWKIKTKGRANSVSANNTALNRRVEVCLR